AGGRGQGRDFLLSSFFFLLSPELLDDSGEVVKKSLSTRTHICQCGCMMDRDENAAKNILSRGLSTVGHTGTFMLDMSNALGDKSSTRAGEILDEQVMSLIKESLSL
ncbi:zinc ribbon domain-containing protein, partial [Aphanizomenon sp. CS-733/32]